MLSCAKLMTLRTQLDHSLESVRLLQLVLGCDSVARRVAMVVASGYMAQMRVQICVGTEKNGPS